MLFYSEKLRKNFKTEKECLEAEAAAEEEKTQRQKDAESVKELQTKYLDAYDAYCKGVEEFVEKYGSYKTTYERANLPILKHFNFFDAMTKSLFEF